GAAFLSDDAISMLVNVSGGMGELAGKIAAGGRPLATLVRSISSFKSNLTSLIGAPGALGGNLQGLMVQLLNLSGKGASRYSTADTLYSSNATPEPVAQITANRVQQAANREAVSELVRRTALVEAARSSAQTDYATHEDAVAVRSTLTTRLNAEARTASGEVRRALRALHGAVTHDIGARGTDTTRLAEITPGATLPALVIAHRMLGDARRADELLTRNPHIRNPLRVPGGVALKVTANG
ncbi:MAG: hypothetical protein K2X44_10170, partial [Magnetospirillum sp.]|nr:hypothetical protein [Magnetospirillum sp.]